MDLRRLRKGEWIAGVSGLVLLVSLFLPWYEVEGVQLDVSAFEAFSAFDVLLVLVALAGMAVVAVIAVQEAPAVGIAVEALLTLVAAVVSILLFFRVLNLPDPLDSIPGAGRTAFPWVGLAATLGVFAGSLVAMRDERLSKPGRPTDSTGAPIDSQPEIETLPAP
jgi:hypothetical protein